jgi:geranylgeranyl diphosphate synthase type II
MNIDTSIQAMMESFEHQLRISLAETPLDERLNEAVAYMLLSAGKRFRPRLILGVNEDLGGRGDDSIYLASAVECIHVASLIHDDLPALDNDDFRRGKPTCHKIFGEAVAVLAGDSLFGMAFDFLSKCDVRRGAKATQYLSRALMGLCAGQSEDLLNLTSDKKLLSMFAKKTGCLIGASAAFGALSSGNSPDKEMDYYNWGVQLGIAFQVADDFRDRFGTKDERGRPESSDQRNAKVGLFQNKSAEAVAEACREQIKQVISSYCSLSGVSAERSATLALIKQQFVHFVAE